MKVKHIIAVHFVLCIALAGLGCASESDLMRRVRTWQTARPDRKGDCMIVTMKTCSRYQRQGIRARIGHGTFKGEPHAWCEYLDVVTGDWLLHDDYVWYIGNARCPVEDIKTGTKMDYEVTWYGEPEYKG